MDDPNASWKNPRDCRHGCGRAATIGYITCVFCRVRTLAARHVPELDTSKLDEAQAICVERSLQGAEQALDSARAVIAVSLGAPTHERPVGEDREVVLGAAPPAAGARAHMPSFSVAGGARHA